MGDRPVRPSKDRRVQVASAGATGGGALGLGVVLLIGVIDRRLRRLQDVQAHTFGTPLLGILPDLRGNAGDATQVRVVTYAVHHIRCLLQMGSDGNAPNVLAVTGSSQGSGKTSLTIALGLSFATAGSRTLLVDCDFKGGELSVRLDARIRRRLGRILEASGAVTESELSRALATAAMHGGQLGEALVALGALTEEQLDTALKTQQKSSVGLLDALAGEPLDRCIVDLDSVRNLAVLPIGGAEPDHAARVSPTAFRELLENASRDFEHILIDTGPIPGGVEGAIAAREADQVILTISRGDDRREVEDTINFLRSLGATVGGAVFNRARLRDIERSKFSASLRASGEYTVGDDSAVRSEGDGGNGVCPVVRAVTTMSDGGEGNGEQP